MTRERTLSIIKPDAVKNQHIGAILSRFEQAGLRIIATKMMRLSKQRAEAFYAIHKDRPFFNDLVAFMTSGPIVVSVLEGENAIEAHRKIMGDTDPQQAAPGTIRADFAQTIDANAVHGSDGPDTAKAEVPFFFETDELQSS